MTGSLPGHCSIWTPGHVIYVGTASKNLAPALRLGWLTLPDRIGPAVTAAKEHADRGSGVLDQLTLAELIASGGFDRRAARASIGLGTLGSYWHQAPGPAPQAVVIGYATPPGHAFRPAVGALARCLRGGELGGREREPPVVRT